MEIAKPFPNGYQINARLQIMYSADAFRDGSSQTYLFRTI